MKKFLGIALAVIMAASLAACGGGGSSEPEAPETQAQAETPAPETAAPETDAPETQAPAPSAEGADAFLGSWSCGRSTMRIVREDEGMKVSIRWGATAWEESLWEYACSYDAERNMLVDEGTGTQQIVTRDDDGEIVSREEVYTDGAAEFSFDEDGNVLWNDLRDDAGANMVYEPFGEAAEVPTPEEFVNDYFHVIGSYHEGTAGSSLAMAEAACQAYAFALEHQIGTVDNQTMRDNMLAGWESMSAEEQSDFDANLISLHEYIQSCEEDFDSMSGPFEDVGLAEAMQSMIADPTAHDCWETLFANTLTMGNSDGA